MEEPAGTPEPAAAWSRGRIVGVALSGLLALGLVLLLVLGLTRDGASLRIDHAIDAGERPVPPDFTLPVFANGGSLGAPETPVTLSTLTGRPVVVNFWASWCGPCANEAPILERIHRRYGGKVLVLGVNSEDDPTKAREFLAQYGITFPNVRVGESNVRLTFDTTKMPETFVLDPDGRVGLKPYRGELTAESEDEIAAHLDAVLAR